MGSGEEKVAVLGVGRMGGGLARAYAAAGREVIWGSRNPEKAARAVRAVVAENPRARIRAADLKGAAAAGEIVVMALPSFSRSPGLAEELRGNLGEELRGKIIVDITNDRPRDWEPSNNERNAEMLGIPARWVAAYKTTFYEILHQPVSPEGVQRDVLICGDDPEAKRVVAQLIESTGWRALDCGPFSHTRIQTRMLQLLFLLNEQSVGGRVSSWKFL